MRSVLNNGGDAVSPLSKRTLESAGAGPTREVQRETRLRLGDTSGEEIKPIAALKAWLDSQQLSPERRALLLEYGEKLIEGEGN